jgi:hypothetical protein
MDKKYPLRLVNNSFHSIGLYFATGGQFGIEYPDTILPVSNKYIIYQLTSGDTYSYDSGISWDRIFKGLPSDTLSIFIFHTDTLKTYNWSIIREQNKILKRYDLSLSDIKNRNFKIIYQ